MPPSPSLPLRALAPQSPASMRGFSRVPAVDSEPACSAGRWSAPSDRALGACLSLSLLCCAPAGKPEPCVRLAEDPVPPPPLSTPATPPSAPCPPARVGVPTPPPIPPSPSLGSCLGLLRGDASPLTNLMGDMARGEKPSLNANPLNADAPSLTLISLRCIASPALSPLLPLVLLLLLRLLPLPVPPPLAFRLCHTFSLRCSMPTPHESARGDPTTALCRTTLPSFRSCCCCCCSASLLCIRGGRITDLARLCAVTPL